MNIKYVSIFINFLPIRKEVFEKKSIRLYNCIYDGVEIQSCCILDSSLPIYHSLEFLESQLWFSLSLLCNTGYDNHNIRSLTQIIGNQKVYQQTWQQTTHSTDISRFYIQECCSSVCSNHLIALVVKSTL